MARLRYGNINEMSQGQPLMAWRLETGSRRWVNLETRGDYLRYTTIKFGPSFGKKSAYQYGKIAERTENVIDFEPCKKSETFWS